MHELMQLKEMLCKELEEYGKKSELTGGSLDVIDKLAHAIKNICKIIDSYEDEEYSGRDGYRQGMRYSRDYDASYRGGNRYSRNYDGRQMSRRYSRASDPGEIAQQIEGLMQDAPNDQVRQSMKQLVRQLEQM